MAVGHHFTVETAEGETLNLDVKVTDEGVIVDLSNDDEVIATWAATAQELADDYCH